MKHFTRIASPRRAPPFTVSLLFLCASAFLLCVSCERRDTTTRITIDSAWQWASGRNAIDGFAPLPKENEGDLSKLLDDSRGFILLRNSFYLTEDLKEEDIALYIGAIKIAAQIRINGFSLGTVGSFPPNEFPFGASPVSMQIPGYMLHRTTANVIELAIWCNGEGSFDYPIIGELSDIESLAAFRSFLLSKLNLLFVATVLIVSAFYLFLFLQRRSDVEYIMYALINFFTVFYLLPFYLSEISWLFNGMDYLWFKKLFPGVAAFITGYFSTSFIRCYFKQKDSPQVSAVRIALLALPIVIVCLAPTLHAFNVMLPVLYSCLFFQILFAVWAILVSFKKKPLQVLSLLIGYTPVLIMLIVDVFVHGVFNNTSLPYFTVLGWQGTIMMFLFILAKRYGQVQKEAEFLNQKLEDEVDARTNELASTNELLEHERKQSEREMDLAVHVQRSFYPHDFVISNGWEIAVYFQPLAGVSGDLYDFYIFDHKFSGLSLFDVSGHGIAAGLVTMLSKNLIFRAFKSNLYKPFGDVMSTVNDSIVRAKGSIENYLTGLMFRVNDEEGNVEMVNAGNPPALLFEVAKDTVTPIFPDKSKKQCGMIGIAGMPVSFQPIHFSMNYGDSLIFYTDGLTECENEYGEDFGRERLMQSFAEEKTGSAEKKLARVLRDFMHHIGDAPRQDDITIIVLKRVYPDSLAAHSDGDDIEELEEIEELDEIAEAEELAEIEEAEELTDVEEAEAIAEAEDAKAIEPVDVDEAEIADAENTDAEKIKSAADAKADAAEDAEAIEPVDATEDTDRTD